MSRAACGHHQLTAFPAARAKPGDGSLAAPVHRRGRTALQWSPVTANHHHPPGPRGLPWLGVTFDLVNDPLGLLERMGHQYGAISEMRYWRGGRILLNLPELIEQVLVVQHQKFIKGGLLRLTAQRLLGQGLLTSEGELWRRQRRAAHPPLLPAL